MSNFFKRFGAAGPVAVLAVVAIAVVASVPAVADPSANASASAKKIAQKALKTAKKALKVANSIPAGEKGDPGAKGATGAQGPAGPQGPAGTPGADGAQGPPGDDGADGAQGPPGNDGADGADGEPWTAGGTLPAGETEKGSWAVSAQAAGPAFAEISWSIPLAAPITLGTNVHFIAVGGSPPSGCSGTVESPGADPGHLCVFAGVMSSVSFTVFLRPTSTGQNAGEANASGTTLGLTASGAGFGHGTFAVTAP